MSNEWELIDDLGRKLTETITLVEQAANASTWPATVSFINKLGDATVEAKHIVNRLKAVKIAKIK